jgi:hypothetical protein
VQDIWKIYAELMGTKKQKAKTKITKLNMNGKILTDNPEISNEMNFYFATIGEKLANANNPSSCNNNRNYARHLKGQYPNTMYLSPTTEEEVLKLKALSPDKAAGPDGIHARSIKIATPTSSNPLLTYSTSQ